MRGDLGAALAGDEEVGDLLLGGRLELDAPVAARADVHARQEVPEEHLARPAIYCAGQQRRGLHADAGAGCGGDLKPRKCSAAVDTAIEQYPLWRCWRLGVRSRLF